MSLSSSFWRWDSKILVGNHRFEPTSPLFGVTVGGDCFGRSPRFLGV